MPEETQTETEKEKISLAEFLENIPPNSSTKVHGLVSVRKIGGSHHSQYGKNLITPEIQLHCPNDSCNGTRFFRCQTEAQTLQRKFPKHVYLEYKCSNCERTIKRFSILVNWNAGGSKGECLKLGEVPAFGPPTSSKLIKLIGPDRDVFLKGRRCENQGLGIGAFSYYRRVVENQKDRILDKVIKVAQQVGAPKEMIQQLQEARGETQFSKAIESVKSAIPESLLISGHNPLTLLHSALSDGLHDRSDEHCLELASHIRVILGELSDRLAQALKDEAEVNNALSKLMAIKRET